jgi:hypothetical protein
MQVSIACAQDGPGLSKPESPRTLACRCGKTCRHDDLAFSSAG